MNIGSLRFLLVAATTMLQHVGSQSCSNEMGACTSNIVCTGCIPSSSSDFDDFVECQSSASEFLFGRGLDDCTIASIGACCKAEFGLSEGYDCFENDEFVLQELCLMNQIQPPSASECTTITCYDIIDSIDESQDSGDTTSGERIIVCEIVCCWPSLLFDSWPRIPFESE